MTRYLVLAWILVSLALPLLGCVAAGLIALVNRVHRPRPHVDLDHDQREMLATLEQIWRLPAYREDAR